MICNALHDVENFCYLMNSVLRRSIFLNNFHGTVNISRGLNMFLAVLILSGIFTDIQAIYENETALRKIYKRNVHQQESEDLYNACATKLVAQCAKIKPEEVKQCKICGLFNSEGLDHAIIEGKDVDPPYLYPWMVALIRSERKVCGGAILNENYILTAGHCITVYDEITNTFARYLKPKELKIGFLTKTDELEKKEVEKILRHPEYHPDKLTYDVALLKLSEKIICDVYKNPICLPPADFKPENQEHAIFYVTGWGTTSIHIKRTAKKLQAAHTRMVDFEKCKANLKTSQLEDISFCLMGIENGRPCFGDSGGSLFFHYKRKFVTIGVASLHTCKQCNANTPFVYTSIPKALQWIKKVIGSYQDEKNKDF